MIVYINQFKDFVGQEVTIRGWVHNKRSSGPISFLEIRDGHGWTQAVAAKNSLSEAAWAATESSTQES